MYKVFAFLKRNPQLTHDEYRAGHVGYHCGQSRRLKNIRGYLVNIWANVPLAQKLGAFANSLQINAPDDFLDYWDGFPQVYFDDHSSWLNARTVEPNRATADGLVHDPDWSLADSPHLFMPAPDDPNQFQANHLHMLETVIVPVIRPEHKIFKLMQFFKRSSDTNASRWQSRLDTQYLPAIAQLKDLRGCILNYRDDDQEAALRGFFADKDWVFSSAAQAARHQFCSYWDGALELYFDSPAAFAAARRDTSAHETLKSLETSLFSRSWFVEVDENLIVNPNRASAPDFYFR